MATGAAALALATGVTSLIPTQIALAQGGASNPLGGAGSASPLTPLEPATPQVPTTTTPTVSNTSTSGGGFTGTDAVLVGVGALVVLGGISFFIWYDARRRAPVRQRPATATAGGPGGGSRPRPKPRKLSPAERRRRKRGRAR